MILTLLVQSGTKMLINVLDLGNFKKKLSQIEVICTFISFHVLPGVADNCIRTEPGD